MNKQTPIVASDHSTEHFPEHFDVLIVGAGLSGVGAAHRLKADRPTSSLVILEGREAIGGTWDLFRYPGVRSDSDMYTLGYAHRPWTAAKAIADGPSILNYVRDAARDAGIEGDIRFRHHVKRADWSSADARWTVEATRGDEEEIVRFTCRFLHMCSGYYDYSQGHLPDFAGAGDFAGTIVHPQFWPEDLDYAGKRIVVIGSGATAVTLVPAMAKTAAHVTMLQHSPTFMVSMPSEDKFADRLRRRLPGKLAHDLIRWRNVLFGMVFFQLARRRPAQMKKKFIDGVRGLLPEGYDVDTHFTPSYNPWDQRVCLVPDADMFDAIKADRAAVVTGHIERFEASGIRLKTGELLPADIIVAATGLKLQLLSGVAFTIDGEARDLSKSLSYKGMMFSDVPNLAYTFGYTNASWTLKADLTASYLCRLLRHMDRTGTEIAIPRRDPSVEEAPFVDFTSGYIQRAADVLPKQGATKPWKLHQNYALDMATLKFGSLDDGVMQFRRREAPVPARMRESA